jgi:hypothetical protein
VLKLSAQNKKKDFLNIHKHSSLLYLSFFFSDLFCKSKKRFIPQIKQKKNQKIKGDGKSFFFEAFHFFLRLFKISKKPIVLSFFFSKSFPFWGFGALTIFFYNHPFFFICIFVDQQKLPAKKEKV